MTETKYGKYVIREPFANSNGKNVFSYDDRDRIGVTYEYHCIDDPNWKIEGNHVHDVFELMCFFGGDSREMLDLGTKVHVAIGEDSEQHTLDSATVVSIPPGMKHGPVSLVEYKKPFVFLKIATTKEYEAKKAAAGHDKHLDAMRDGSPVLKDGNKHWMNIIQGPFFREKEPGYNGQSISAVHNEYGSATTLGYHSIFPSYGALTPHSHSHAELLCFLGGDPKNVKDLKADVTVCLGEEQEPHSFNTATIVSIPPDLPHCPVTVENAEQPVVFLVICTSGEKIDNF